jgi:hypothetical protein
MIAYAHIDSAMSPLHYSCFDNIFICITRCHGVTVLPGIPALAPNPSVKLSSEKLQQEPGEVFVLAATEAEETLVLVRL